MASFYRLRDITEVASERHLVYGLCDGRVNARATFVPWGKRYRPIGGDYQDTGYAFKGADQNDEPQLYGAQIPTNQATPVCKSRFTSRSGYILLAYYHAQVFRPRTPPEAIDLVSKLLEYTPGVRLSSVEAMVHPFFDELRVEGARMPNGKEFPPLFNFTREGPC